MHSIWFASPHRAKLGPDVTADWASQCRVKASEPIPYYSRKVCELNSAPYLNRSISVCIAYGLRVRTELSSVQPFQLGAGFLEFSKLPRRTDLTSTSHALGTVSKMKDAVQVPFISLGAVPIPYYSRVAKFINLNSLTIR